MRLPAFVCLSVCLLATLLKNACMDLDEMLPVDTVAGDTSIRHSPVGYMYVLLHVATDMKSNRCINQTVVLTNQ